MIEIEITKAPTQEFIGTRVFDKNFVTVGDLKADIPLRGDDVLAFHLFLKIMNKECHCYPNKNLSFFHLNKKRTTTPVMLLPNDVITVAGYDLRLNKFEKSAVVSRQENLESKLRELHDKHPGIHRAIHFLAKEFGII